MANTQVLRLRRTDADSEFVLVHVARHGSKPLDLKLVASEGEHVYPVKLKDSSVKTLQANNYGGDLDQWKATLRFALLRERPDNGVPEMLQGIETVCSLERDTLIITIRKNIGGIHQRLGTIVLSQNDEEEINPYDWAAISTAKVDELLQNANEMQISAKKHEDDVAKLTKQLEDLVHAKKDHESEILKKCAALLNAKKLKIRDQQRLLSGAKIDINDAELVSTARRRDEGGKGRTAALSRGSKRKANGHAESVPEGHNQAETDDDDAEEPDAELEQDQETPDPTDDEAEEEYMPSSSKTTPPSSTRATGKASDNAKRSLKGNVKGGDSAGQEDSSLPPQRELPFTKKAGVSNNAQNKSIAARPGSRPTQDDETDDEEL
ncbi:hypothetical protein LTR78_009018 [Recurvomyces mirabilis]|uniref:Uncharacterized protein n=1 Tax=Recurvomyces mirabilis TaxID=574656 RepID=A0AAE0TP54_9PEZI|nr:hypothetical protein LTR78_009018 [Recurvomyces mirabilis]KAK5150455.1 hypothetical protein LTS14_010145 [Recurvomyces mirabilis]